MEALTQDVRLTLYSLETDLVELFDIITDAHERGEEPPAEVMAMVKSYVDAAIVKRDRCGQFLKHLEALEESIQNEIERLQKRAQSITKAHERMESMILLVMDMIGKKRLEGSLFCFTAAKNPPSVVIDNVTEIPETFLAPQKPAPAREPDKTAIKKVLQAGENVPGARLVSKTRLQIK